MSLASGRVSLNNLSTGRCVPRSSKKKAKLAKRAAKLLARRENDNLHRPSTAVASCTLEEAPSQEVIPAISVTAARELHRASSTDNRESAVGVCSLPSAGDNGDALQPHILAYCSHMSSSTVEMIRNTAEGQANDLDGSSMYDGAAGPDAEGEAGWHVVDCCPPLEEEDEAAEEEDVEEEGFLVVPQAS